MCWIFLRRFLFPFVSDSNVYVQRHFLPLKILLFCSSFRLLIFLSPGNFMVEFDGCTQLRQKGLEKLIERRKARVSYMRHIHWLILCIGRKKTVMIKQNENKLVEMERKLLVFCPMKIDRSLISFSFYSAFRSNRPIKTMHIKLSFRHVPIDMLVKFGTYKNLISLLPSLSHSLTFSLSVSLYSAL